MWGWDSFHFSQFCTGKEIWIKCKRIYVLWAIKSSTANWMTIRLRVLFCERVVLFFEKGEKVAGAASSNVFPRNRGALHVFKGRRCSLFFALLAISLLPFGLLQSHPIRQRKGEEGVVICNKWCNSNLPIFQFCNIVSFSQLFIFQNSIPSS